MSDIIKPLKEMKNIILKYKKVYYKNKMTFFQILEL